MKARTLIALGHVTYISPTGRHPLRPLPLLIESSTHLSRPPSMSATAMTLHKPYDTPVASPLPSPPAYSSSRSPSPHVKYPPEPRRSAFSGVYVPTLAMDGSVGVRSMRQRKGAPTPIGSEMSPATQRALQLSGVISKSSSRSDGSENKLERRRSIRAVVDLLARTLCVFHSDVETSSHILISS